MLKSLWILIAMPIENITPSQNQGRLFEERLSKTLNPPFQIANATL